MLTILPPALKGRPHKYETKGNIQRAVPLTAQEQSELDWLVAKSLALHKASDALCKRAEAVFEEAVQQLPCPKPMVGGFEQVQHYSGGQGWDGLHGDTAEDGGDYYLSTEWVFPTKEDREAWLLSEKAWMAALMEIPEVATIHVEMEQYGRRREEYYRRRQVLDKTLGRYPYNHLSPLNAAECGQELARTIRDWLGGYFGDGVRHRLKVKN